ncbi:hypothetical protein [Niastella vici]|nr:hypothetical protein [Niastella vici]
MKNAILYLSLILVFCSCASGVNKKVHLREYAFNDSGLKVITARLNDRSGTMSTLYGNSAAFDWSMGKNTSRIGGEVYKLVTYKQQDHAFWYGSRINGKVIQVETLQLKQQAGRIVPVYTIEYPGPADTLASINYMMNATAAYFP